MNAHRRQTGHITIALLIECNHNGIIGDEAHLAITDTLVHMRQEEYHQLRAQEKHEGKNATTDKQIAICRVALPALEEAVKAWNKDDFETVITKLRVAISTDGVVPTPPKKTKIRRGK